ncbi:hypothetical protein [Bacillus cereus]|uniref:hypothetical protein n=1 Tax=Bacillus cereus group TaxID=86661 RepID=UPI001FACB64B
MKKRTIATLLATISMSGTLIVPTSSFADSISFKGTSALLEKKQVHTNQSVPVIYQNIQNDRQHVIGHFARVAILNALYSAHPDEPWMKKIIENLGPTTGNWVMKKAKEIAHVLEGLTTWEKSTITAGLVKIGIPEMDAGGIATIIVFLIGF